MQKIGSMCVALALSVLLPSSALAGSCTLSQLAGKWQGYSFNGYGGAGRCMLLVSSTGTIKTGSKCIDNYGNSAAASGSFRMISTATCTVRASIKFAGINNYVRHGQVDLDKASMTGIGNFYENGSWYDFLFTANKL